MFHVKRSRRENFISKIVSRETIGIQTVEMFPVKLFVNIAESIEKRRNIWYNIEENHTTEEYMARIIAFANQKGGVGKTTSAVNVAASLGIIGFRTLLIDLDPQGNATSGVGVSKKNLKLTIQDVLLEKAGVEDVVIQTKFNNLSLLPANPQSYQFLLSQEQYSLL